MNKTESKKEKSNVPILIKSDLLLFHPLVLGNADSPLVIEKHAILSNTLLDKLSTVSNPYVYILDLVYNSSEILTHDTYGNFNFKILNLFLEWLEVNSTEGLLTLEFKRIAAEKLVLMKNSVISPCISTIQLFYKIFKLNEHDDMIKEIIDSHLANGQYAKVCPIIIALELQPFYSLDQVVLPLLFNDRRPMVERYLENYTDMQMELAKILDNICMSQQAIQSCLEQTKIQLQPSITKDKLSTQHMKKVLGRLLKTFKIPIQQCPNLVRERGFAALNYLMKKRFRERAITHEAWTEMIELTVFDNSELQRQLLISLIRQNELNLAVHMAYVLQIDEREWPQGLLEYSKGPTYRPIRFSEPKHRNEMYLSLNLDLCRIYFIDTTDKFLDCLNSLETYPIIGFDAEWRPSFGFDVPSDLALLQLAVHDQVFLLDYLALKDCLTSEHWHSFTEKIFCNPQILKLGFATRDDLNILRRTCLITDKKKSLSKVVDLNPLIKQIFKCNPEISMYLPVGSGILIQSLSLSEACFKLLGKPLNKEEQLSNWEKRPLRQAQLIYASLDAFCLIQIFEKLSEIAAKWDLDIMSFINLQITNQPSQNTKFELFKNMIEDRKINYSRLPLPIDQFKILVDNSLSDLEIFLKSNGAIVQQLNLDLNPESITELANTGSWCFVASGRSFVKSGMHWPRGTCFCVNMTLSVQEQFNAVCDYFNVPITGHNLQGSREVERESPKKIHKSSLNKSPSALVNDSSQSYHNPNISANQGPSRGKHYPKNNYFYNSYSPNK